MKYIKIYIQIIIVLIANFGIAQNSENLPEIQADSTFRYGKLHNGLTYYIKHSEKPKNMADFYIAHDVGALQEDDSQNGLAHFLEHMAFNGSTNFPKKGIQELLERNGVSFGSAVNAYTGMSETVYNINGVPTGNPKFLDSVVLVLHDWSRSLKLELEEINAERAVIKEEWRTRNTPQLRLQNQVNPILYYKSKYAKRDVIGDMNLIENFKPKVLKDFYKKWYRPDLQAIFIVGDFDVFEMEKRAKRILSKIPKIENPTPKETYTIAENKELLFKIATDKEASKTPSISYTFKKPVLFTKEQRRTKSFLENALINFLITIAIDSRFQELAKEESSPFYSSNYSKSEVLETSFLGFSINPKENKVNEAFEATIVEIERLKKYGLLQSEIDRAKKYSMSVYEYALKAKKDKTSLDYIGEYQGHFLYNSPLMKVEDVYEITKNFNSTITLNEINNHLKLSLEGMLEYPYKNTILTLVGATKKQGTIYPSKKEMIQIIKKGKNNKSITPFRNVEVPISLMPEDVKIIPGKIIHKKPVLEGTSAVQYTLSNGVKVVLYPTENEANNIDFVAISRGGFSVLRDDLIPSSFFTSHIAANSGIGKFDHTTLRKVLIGKSFNSSPSINEFTEALQGNSTLKDLEYLFQGIYLQFTQPRFDEVVLNRNIEQSKIDLKEGKEIPAVLFEKKINEVYNKRTHRRPEFSEDLLSKVTLAKIEEIYKDRFSDPNNFTFFFVGKIEEEKMLPLLEKYLGSLTSNCRAESWVFDDKEQMIIPTKDITSHFKVKMKVAKSTILIRYHGAKEYNLNAPEKLSLDIVSQIFEKKLFQSIREKEGGTYGASVFSNINKIPIPSYAMTINLDADPKKTKKLLTIIDKEFKMLIANGATAEEFENIKKSFLKSIEPSRKQNMFLLNAIYQFYETGVDLISVDRHRKLINELSLEKFNKIIKKLLKDSKKVEVVMSPKKK